MKILHISTVNSGGAANATRRIHEGLLKQGIDSKWLVLVKKEDPTKEIYPFYENENIIQTATKAIVYATNKLKLIGRDGKYEVFSSPNSLIDITRHPLFKWADIINLHWVAYFLDYNKYFSKNKKTVWRLSDMVSFTGGCHYTYECDGFKSFCESCPQLKGTIFRLSAQKNIQIKENALSKNNNLTVVGVTDWVANEARKSRLFKDRNVVTIENSIDISVFKPYPRSKRNKIQLLVVADDFNRYNKGFELLLRSIDQLKDKDKYKLVIVGRGYKEGMRLPVEVENKGFVQDKNELANYFSKADITLIPSRYETFNQTTIESMACGTPVVAFDNSGPSKIIKHLETGYLAEAFSVEDFKNGIQTISKAYSDGFDFQTKCLELINSKYTQEIQAKRYIELYESLM